MTDLSVWLFCVLIILYVILKFLNLGEKPKAPELFYHQDDSFVNEVLKFCPIFQQPYVPPLLWGRNGHLHTFAFAKVSPTTSFKPTSRHSVKLEDNSTVIFDIFEPAAEDKRKSVTDFTVIVVPGIANDSSAAYVELFCEHATNQGFRIVVLNHLGVLPVKLTSKRIFTYGSTCELKAMVGFVRNNYANTKLIGLGFSLGGNILLKYLGENKEHQKNFITAVSVCQGYDILKSWPFLEEWDGFRRGYNCLIAQRVKQIIKKHSNELWGGCVTTSNHQQLERNKVLMATSLKDVDEHFVRRMAGYQCLTDYYRDSSCSNYINNVKIPMLLLNAQDDPLIPEELLDTPKNHVKGSNSKSLFVLSQFGGHLGFYEGGFFIRHSQTWLNKAILQYLNAVLGIIHENSEKKTEL